MNHFSLKYEKHILSNKFLDGDIEAEYREQFVENDFKKLA